MSYRVIDTRTGGEVQPGDTVTAVRHGATATFTKVVAGSFIEVDEPGTSIRCSYAPDQYGLKIERINN